MQRAQIDSATGLWTASVDDLYRFHTARSTLADSVPASSRGFIADLYKGLKRESAYGVDDGRRNAMMYFPESRTFVVVLTTDNGANARWIAEQIADQLLAKK
jgi:hypothetical protein